MIKSLKPDDVMSIKVLHLVWDGNLGGVQRYLLKILNAPYWHQVSHGICFFSHPGKILSEETLIETPCYAIGLNNGWQLIKAHRLHHIIKDFDPEILHCHCDTPAFGTQIHQYRQRRLIFHEHGDTLMRTDRRLVTQGLWRYTGQFWDDVIVNSRFTYHDFIQKFPWMDNRCHIVHNPFLDCSAPPSTQDKKYTRPTIGVFARMVPQKGLDWMLEVTQKIVKKIPNVEVRFYGEGPLRDQLIKTCDQLQLQNNVNFVGFVQSPLEEMAKVHCVAIPSRIEPFGLVSLEAQGVGVPVVGFTNSGVEETIIQGETGFIVPHGDLNEMAEALCRLLQNPALSAEMSVQALIHVKESFNLQRHIQALEMIYRGALPQQQESLNLLKRLSEVKQVPETAFFTEES